MLTSKLLATRLLLSRRPTTPAMSCENCFKGYILPGLPVGSIVHGDYYSPAETPTDPKKALILLTDIFGLDLVNSKLLADYFAKTLAVDVWVPDLFDGHPPVTVDELEPITPDRAGVTMPWGTTLRFLWLMIPRIFKFYALRASLCDARVHASIAKIKAEKGYDTIGAVGYCYGGAAAARLAGTDLVKTVVITHPSVPSDEQVKAIKVPTSWACAEEDARFPSKHRDRVEALLQARKQDGAPDATEFEFTVYKGTAHGFAARPNLALPEIREAFEGAREQAVQWFRKTL
ncbi:dienelactone hydrolase endo-1-3,1,4-beta-D-glucanase [Artomyces pyxidatus]|uniref:Dienelactone hydrolase endo-1-3,1,4-beta-D-glucanase n=1 Tax=Artomyces pyxidatus TaxID=48021 RepID=A0ACB8SIM9_9AGAM|nr:dienelactone hydrolase endo-1-3,1,4-beta-D-glucanase [Artomyces pyxidatus]